MQLPLDRLPRSFASAAEERLHLKQRLAAAFRLFAKFGYDEGVAGHITARDPEHRETFWVNPFTKDFSQITVSNLIRIDHAGEVVEGSWPVNRAAFAIHSRLHAARPDVIAAAHTHSLHGKAFATLGKLLDPITQDSCAFYEDHGVFADYTGVVLDLKEGDRIAEALGGRKAVILRNHGLLTVGQTVDAAAFWFITMDRCCHAQLLADAAGETVKIAPEMARLTSTQVGSPIAGYIGFQPLYDRIVKEQPDLLD
ncbi:MAG: Class aldolase/adducin family protein [Myxococcaceae bacterium]|nr:Class aldolase/adducin family protein [Myxococcaceae bacterium]